MEDRKVGCWNDHLLYLQKEKKVLFHRVLRVVQLCFYSSPDGKIQTLGLERVFSLLSVRFGYSAVICKHMISWDCLQNVLNFFCRRRWFGSDSENLKIWPERWKRNKHGVLTVWPSSLLEDNIFNLWIWLFVGLRLFNQMYPRISSWNVCYVLLLFHIMWSGSINTICHK